MKPDSFGLFLWPKLNQDLINCFDLKSFLLNEFCFDIKANLRQG